MKKVLFISALTIASVASISNAQSFEQYVSGKGAVRYSTYKVQSNEDNEEFKESKSVAGLRLAYGLVFPMGENSLRAELEYGLNGTQKMDKTLDEGNVQLKNRMKSQSLMANVYYDFNTGTRFTPYVGAGLGYAHLKNEVGIVDHEDNDNYSISKSKGNFAWNVSVGTSYKMDNNLSLDVSYRFTDYGKVKFNASENNISATAKLRSNELNFGVRYQF